MGDGPSFKAWKLPLMVFGIAVPITVGFVTEGPGLGLALGALAVAALLVLAARMRPDVPIEVARSPDDRHHVLIVAAEAVEDPSAVDDVVEALEGAEGEPDDVLVLAPARNTFLDHWATDLEPGRREAQRKLVLSVAALAAASIEARGKVGDSDLLQATEDALRSFPADEVILVTRDLDQDRDAQRLATEMRRRLRRPLTHVRAGSTGRTRSASAG
jgi:hypothetical protein